LALGMLLANQDTQDHSGRKAASRNSRGRCVWRATLSRKKGLDANLGSLDRVYEALAAPGGGKVIEPSDGDGAGVRTGVPGGHDTHRPFTNRKAVPGEGTVIRHVLGAPGAWRLSFKRRYRRHHLRGYRTLARRHRGKSHRSTKTLPRRWAGSRWTPPPPPPLGVGAPAPARRRLRRLAGAAPPGWRPAIPMPALRHNPRREGIPAHRKGLRALSRARP